MTRAEYRAALRAFGVSRIGAADLWGVGPRTAQRYAAEGPPEVVARAIWLLQRFPKPERDELIALMMAKGRAS